MFKFQMSRFRWGILVKGRMQYARSPNIFLLGRIAYALVTPYMWCKRANAIRPCAEIFFIVGAYCIRPGYALHVV